ncbi:helix-turn-helix domain-containing protein [Desulfovibrio intestinalis]|uniref:Excisionase family DNA binding protein n=1 Tax=Desulfovibrio intestinalis TaxID=58621 RepID=A0A7W8FG72_9BACT|nr:helix-turn-helix domain-containing protein [Desulfovibrio intestinalis]MBB5142517.1 excisionase family DNA binding protein [Desulfovibrio intestinalis]
MTEVPFTQGWLTLRDVAEILLISPATVRRLIASGRLKASNVSSSTIRPLWRIHPQWLEEYATSQPEHLEKEENPPCPHAEI